MEKVNHSMENLTKMVNALEKALNRLKNPSNPGDIEFFQDSVVARFKILIESTWKNIKHYLQEEGFTDVPASPKSVLHFAREAQFLSPQEHDALLNYLSLRNLASPLYDQPQYVLVVTAAPEALQLIQQLITRIEKKLYH